MNFFRPVTPNRKLQADFRNLLYANLDEMSEDVQKEILALYQKVEPRVERSADGGMVTDANPPAQRLGWLMRLLYARWQKHYNELSNNTGAWFAKTAAAYVKDSMALSFKEAGFRGRLIQSGALAYNDIKSSITAECAALIKTIPQQFFERISVMVNESLRHGRDMDFLTKELKKAYEISKRRSIVIARDQTAKATESLAITRAQSFGLTEAVWIHRGGGKVPREDHVKANGKKFDLRRGCLIDGEYIFPAQKVNCHCTFRLVFPEE